MEDSCCPKANLGRTRKKPRCINTLIHWCNNARSLYRNRKGLCFRTCSEKVSERGRMWFQGCLSEFMLKSSQVSHIKTDQISVYMYTDIFKLFIFGFSHNLLNNLVMATSHPLDRSPLSPLCELPLREAESYHILPPTASFQNLFNIRGQSNTLGGKHYPPTSIHTSSQMAMIG